MSDPIDEVLAQELKKAADLGAQLGMDVAAHLAGPLGVTDPPEAATEWAARGGRRGVDFAAKYLTREIFEASFTCDGSIQQTLMKCAHALVAVGERIEGDPTRPEVAIRGVVHAGFKNMNPAVVDVVITRARTNHCLVTVVGHAKEGMIRQKTAERAVRRLLLQLGVDDG